MKSRYNLDFKCKVTVRERLIYTCADTYLQEVKKIFPGIQEWMPEGYARMGMYMSVLVTIINNFIISPLESRGRCESTPDPNKYKYTSDDIKLPQMVSREINGGSNASVVFKAVQESASQSR